MEGKFYTPLELSIAMVSEGIPPYDTQLKIEEATWSKGGVEIQIGKQKFTIFRNGCAGHVESFHVIEKSR